MRKPEGDNDIKCFRSRVSKGITIFLLRNKVSELRNGAFDI